MKVRDIVDKIGCKFYFIENPSEIYQVVMDNCGIFNIKNIQTDSFCRFYAESCLDLEIKILKA